jgi:hypothetical protein
MAADTKIYDSQSLTATDTSTVLKWDVRPYTAGSVQIVGSGISGAWTVTLYGSNNGSSHVTFPTSVTLDSTGSGLSSVLDLSGYGYLHAKITSAAAAGTLAFYVCGKADK